MQAGSGRGFQLDFNNFDRSVCQILERMSVRRTPYHVAGVVRDLLTSATPALRVAVAARVALPLRLSKLQAAGRAAQFGPADLAFSPEECAEVLQAANGREADAAELDALWSATEGWPLGVALSAASAGAPAPGALGSTALAGFLEEELLGPLGGELRAALLEHTKQHAASRDAHQCSADESQQRHGPRHQAGPEHTVERSHHVLRLQREGLGYRGVHSVAVIVN